MNEQTPRPPRISAVTLESPAFDTPKRIEFITDEPVTLLHADNGWGKTVMLRSIWETAQALEGGLCPSLDELDLIELKPLIIEFSDGRRIIHERDSNSATITVKNRNDEEEFRNTVETVNAERALDLLRRRFRRGTAQTAASGASVHPYSAPREFYNVLRHVRNSYAHETGAAENLVPPASYPLRLEEGVFPGSRTLINVEYISTERIPPHPPTDKTPLSQAAPRNIPDLLDAYSLQMALEIVDERRTALTDHQSESLLEVVVGYLEEAHKQGPDDSETESDANQLDQLFKEREILISNYTMIGLDVFGIDDSGSSKLAEKLALLDVPGKRLILQIIESDIKRLKKLGDVYNRMHKIKTFVNVALESEGMEFVFNNGLAALRNPTRQRVEDEFRHRHRLQAFSVHKKQPDSSTVQIPFSHLPSGIQHRIVLAYRILWEASSDDVVLIDEPEISFDMRWQMSLVDDLIEMARMRRLQILVATHSALLIGDHEHLAYPPFDDPADRIA